MHSRPYVSFAEIKQKVSISDVLTALGMTDRFQGKGETLTGVCPLPRHQHGPSPNAEQFKINHRDGIWLWHCFGDCQRGGDVIELVKEMTGFDNAHVRFWFAEKFGDRLTAKKPQAGCSESDAKTKRAREAHLENETSQAPKSISANLPNDALELKPLRFRLNLDPAVPYLNERGLTAETIARYGLGLCNRGVLKGYVAIPVYGYPHPGGSNPLAYLGRWPGDDFDEASRPRYKWPEGFCRGRVVYSLSQALEAAQSKPLVIVEGPFSVYHLFQAGFPNVVATFGAGVTDEQAAILIATRRPLLLMFDGDQAGKAGTQLALPRLADRSFVRVVRLFDGQSPDDLSPAELRDLLQFIS